MAQQQQLPNGAEAEGAGESPSPAPPPAEARGPLTAGEAVRAFYHAADHPAGYRYVRVLEVPGVGAPDAGRLPFTVGLTTGWVPATVVEDYDPAARAADDDGKVTVLLHGKFADPYRPDQNQVDADGLQIGYHPVENMYWKVDRALIIGRSEPFPKLDLSLFVVRWWDYFGSKVTSRSHNVLHEGLILDVLQGDSSPHQVFGSAGRYEVYSAFVTRTEDLRCLDDALFAKRFLRGARQAGMYFLWPTQRLPLGRGLKAGSVLQPDLFGAMRSAEGHGVATCWPHPVPLYAALAGKTWMPEAAGDAEVAAKFQVPPSVAVDVKAWKADERPVAQDAIERLRQLRARRGGHPAPAAEEFRGVAKLGYSWQGEGVQPFTGVDGLQQALQRLFDGMGPDTQCYVQERIEDVRCEIRLVCCRDRAAGPDAFATELVRMRLHPPRHGDTTFALTSGMTMTAEEAALECFDGSTAALEAAEARARELAQQWLQKLGAEGPGVPHVCRIDFLAAMPSKQTDPAAAVEVHTIEVTECGGSMCRIAVAPRTAAVLNECMLGAPGWTPRPLPEMKVEEWIPESPSATTAYEGGAGAKPTKATSVALPRRAAIAAAVVAFLMLLARRRGRSSTWLLAAASVAAAVLLRRFGQEPDSRPAGVRGKHNSPRWQR